MHLQIFIILQSMDDSSDIPDVSLITGHLRPTYNSSDMETGVVIVL